MTNKEQLLYFFLSGNISLSQYDYKFMANLQTMIQNKNRVTSNQAALFDNLISKYKKQLTKSNFDKDILKSLPWKTMVVESTPEYTGATVSLANDTISIRVPFNKSFITEFRNVNNNTFDWDKETKRYTSAFNTNALKIAYVELPKHFDNVRFDDQLSALLSNIEKYNAMVYNPTLRLVNGKLVVAAVNEVLGNILADMELNLDSKTLFKLSLMGIDIDNSIYENNPRLEFASNRVVEIEITQIEYALSCLKSIGCDNVVVGRGLRNILNNDGLTTLTEKYGMRALGPMSFGRLPEGITALIQHTSNIDVRNAFQGQISKTVVLKDSRPIEVK